MTVVVTGASGFIGGHLVSLLLAGGREVIALTRDRRRLDARPGLQIVETDYARIDLPRGSTVVHLLAVRNTPGNSAAELMRVNVGVTQQLAHAARASGVRRFIHIGTALVLGASRIPSERTELVDDDDPYIASKIAGIRALESIEGLPLVTLLPAIVYGPDHSHARNRITSHMRRLLARRWRFAISGASAPRNLVFIDDVVRAIAQAESDAPGTRRVIAGENATQDELECVVFAAAGRKPTPRIVVPHAFANVSARAIDTILRREQGWSRRLESLLAPWCFPPSSSHTSLRDGVAATVRSL